MAPKVVVGDRAALSRVITRAEAALVAARRAADESEVEELSQERCDAAEQARAELISALGELCRATGRHPAAFVVLVTEELSQWLFSIPGGAPTQALPVHGGEDSGG
jgi:hypothetical protein